MLIRETPTQLENHIDHETIAVSNVGAAGRLRFRIFGLYESRCHGGAFDVGRPAGVGPGIAGRLGVAGRRRG